MKKRHLLAAALLAFAGSTQAQLLSGMSAPTQVRAGEPVKLMVNFEVPSGTNCGLHLHWGDGVSDTHKINQAGDVPLRVSHTYAKPGNYQIIAEPKRVGSSLKCGGANQHVTIAVTGAAAATAKKPKRASSASQP
jgi:hypothetical protein